jgi:hypothetical protein
MNATGPSADVLYTVERKITTAQFVDLLRCSTLAEGDPAKTP